MKPVNFIVDQNNYLPDYENIDISNIKSITNGYIKEMVCSCLDELDFDIREFIFMNLIEKLSFDGTLRLKMINSTLLAHKILRNEISPKKVSEIISQSKSMWSDYLIMDHISNLNNIDIEKLYSENVYSVIILHKHI
jgi:hypothetical protein